MVSAHEFGHSVLIYVGGIDLSWTHKNATYLIQVTKPSTPGFPNHGEIDLMKYYNKEKNDVDLNKKFNNSIATEIDIKRLIWCSEITWEG